MSSLSFKTAGFIRSGGGVTFEERCVQPSDFTRGRYSTDYATEYAESPSTFMLNYPNWQEFADCFIMRRAIINISGSQCCDTSSFNASDIKNYTDPGFVTVRNFKIPKTTNSMPSGKYQLTNLSFTDNGDSTTNVSLSYQQHREWKLIKLQNSPPSPK